MLKCSGVVVLNHLVLTVSGPRSESLRQICVTSGDGQVVARYGDKPDGDRAGLLTLHVGGRSFAKQEVIYSFVTDRIVDHTFIASLESVELSAEVTFDLQSERLPLLIGRAAAEDVGRLSPTLQRRLVQDKVVGGLFAALAAGRVSAMGNVAIGLDYAFGQNGLLFISGWLANFDALDVYVLTDGVAHVCSHQDMIAQNRSDVTEFLRGQGPNVPGTDFHGFCAVLPKVSAGSEVTIGILQDNAFLVLHACQPQLATSNASIFPKVIGAWQSSSKLPLNKAMRMIAPFLQSPNHSRDYHLPFRSIFQAARPPVLSVVVPFYKEWRLLYSVLAMVRRSPDNWEWVFVCDDPTIVRLMRQLISSSPDGALSKITFVVMRTNVGYGIANNIGVREAGAPHVLLMNSDIWMADFESVQKSLSIVERGDFDLLGFTLLFEDGTVQHDGLSFRRSAEFDTMYLALHPGKGLPPADLTDAVQVRSATAVTGALMLTSKSLFEKIGGFSDRYIGGDFEDADLCLTLGRLGRRIGLARVRGIFHLERQSIRRDAGNQLGFARTLVNCDRFNRHWAGHLDSSLAEAGTP